jgi:hypothetical protein
MRLGGPLRRDSGVRVRRFAPEVARRGRGFHGPVSCGVVGTKVGWSAGRRGPCGGQGAQPRDGVRTVAAQAWWAARCSSRRRPVRTRVAGTVNSWVRSRLGSHRRASALASASICIQGVTSQASATMAHQIWFWAKSCSATFQLVNTPSSRLRRESPGVSRGTPRLQKTDQCWQCNETRASQAAIAPRSSASMSSATCGRVAARLSVMTAAVISANLVADGAT